ncbi:hypothetical protein PPYR_01603 [Photinus pyralis]|uniref:Peptidase S1 domain-containing protein n=1 Tax=Photinus pyralis TaxID=7054 RepID=A0A5N4B515_PHOPY|nr:trypsin-1-like [Photinus pyralis]KAB0804633.1 hypothetical protein PPYR_01603 [Photinus pyralis]
MLRLITVLVCIAFTRAAPSKIVNGTNAEKGEIPYIVSLRVGGRHTCGGSILNENHVLTAAHCLSNRKYSIQYGVLQLSSDNTNSIDVEKIMRHEYYDPYNRHANDVAVLKLMSAIPIDNVNVRPTTLPSQAESAPDGNWGVLAGWGAVITGGGAYKQLQRVDILVYSPANCRAAHGNSVNEKYHLCAGVPEGWKGQCSGDSGGPLVAEGKQVGVVSWSIKPCAVVGYPGVFARVASYTDWIWSKVDLN